VRVKRGCINTLCLRSILKTCNGSVDSQRRRPWHSARCGLSSNVHRNRAAPHLYQTHWLSVSAAVGSVSGAAPRYDVSDRSFSRIYAPLRAGLTRHKRSPPASRFSNSTPWRPPGPPPAMTENKIAVTLNGCTATPITPSSRPATERFPLHSTWQPISMRARVKETGSRFLPRPKIESSPCLSRKRPRRLLLPGMRSRSVQTFSPVGP